MDGPDHARMRAVQKPGYQRAVIEQRLDDVVASIERYVREWPQGQALPAHRALQSMVTEQLGGMITGVSPDGYVDDLIHFVRTALLTHVTRQRPAFMRWLPRYRRARARVLALGHKVIAQHAPTAHTRSGNLIDDLLNISREDPAFFPSTDLLIGVLGPFVAGLDTVASTTAFVLYVLATNPELRARIVAEVDELFEAGPLTAAGLRQLDVLHRTIMETMRLYPIAPAITRRVAVPFEFGGYTVDKGEQVIIGTTVAHTMEELYAEPERFDIDRFLPERNEHRKPGAYAPFGAGPHVCLGAGFAEVHLMIFVAALLRHAELAMDPADYQLRVDPAPTPHPDQGFRIRLTARSRAK
jgi:cytochrome P450